MADEAYALLERELERATIVSSIERAVQGEGGILLIEGPAGIGKSRLLLEAQRYASSADAYVLRAQNAELEKDVAFSVVRQLFDPFVKKSDPEAQNGWWSGPAANIRSVFGTADPESTPLGDFAVLHGLFWLAANIAQDHALVLLIDDLQWCDIPSLRYIAYLLPRIESMSVLVVAGLRSDVSPADDRLLSHLHTDTLTQVLRPAPLSKLATEELMAQALSSTVESDFAFACHVTSGGNPLLLHELARTLAAEHVEPLARNSHHVANLAPRKVAAFLEARMSQLPSTAFSLVQAVAILGDDTPLHMAVSLAVETAHKNEYIAPQNEWLNTAATLDQLEILLLTQRKDDVATLSFVHPLIRSTVYKSLDAEMRSAMHRKAAQTLRNQGADHESIATHLLHAPPVGDQQSVVILRTAAKQAMQRGAPGNAYTYLNRALAEPLPADVRLQVLVDAGQAAVQIDLKSAAGHLHEAYRSEARPEARADIAVVLSTIQSYLLRPSEGIAVLMEALSQLPDREEDRKRLIEAGLLATATWVLPGRGDILGGLERLRGLPQRNTVSGYLLDCVVSSRQMVICDRQAIPRARRAVQGLAEQGRLIELANGDLQTCAWNTLLAADDEAGMDSLQTALSEAHSKGSLYALTGVFALRSCGWLYRGQLAEAEQDSREALRLVNLTSEDFAKYFACTFLADSLIEQNRLDESEDALAQIGVVPGLSVEGPVYLALATLSRLLYRRGDYDRALKVAYDARDVCRSYGIDNPAFVNWHTEAAYSLAALKRENEAHLLADDQVGSARQWGAPRTLGRALRLSGVLTGGAKGELMLQESVDILKDSPAQLEYVKSLTAVGVNRLKFGDCSAARTTLRQALDVANRCGAEFWSEEVRRHLKAAGGRPRRAAITGRDSLTPSELRIAVLAAEGLTNREIAQNLYVTPKTVEVHLSSVYRKLRISSRGQLSSALHMRGEE
ncbi:AAA family ATPase [Streptomyces collinus]|uniref:helix-turn-helix transcriptional regulator n=1 Tax=Streptomyces collinus TaxID=42684 RepID=UPI0036E5BC9E